ncbi:MAG: recombination-associated protein RdgC [Gammaproteobacteria bacterium]|nr:recombination-associated protein RdgC [Gammaproteobacteria bacterium]
MRDTLHQANVVRCRQQELATQEVRGHLEAGKQVNGLGLCWNDRLNFVLAEDHGRKAKGTARSSRRTPARTRWRPPRFDADFALMSLELDRQCEDLLEVFGDRGGLRPGSAQDPHQHHPAPRQRQCRYAQQQPLDAVEAIAAGDLLPPGMFCLASAHRVSVLRPWPVTGE